MGTIEATQPIRLSSVGELKQASLENNVRDALARFGFKEISDARDQFIILDLSSSYWYDIGTMLWLITLMHKLKKQGNDLQVVFPEQTTSSGRNLWSFLLRWRFFEAVAECVDDPMNLLCPKQIPYLRTESRYGHSTFVDQSGKDSVLHGSRLLEITTFGGQQAQHSEQSDSIDYFLRRFGDKVVISALGHLCGWNSEESGEFAKIVVGEGIRNGSLHSEGSFVIVAMRVDARYLTLAIADNGIGIPATLRTQFRKAGHAGLVDNKTDAEILGYYADPQFVLDSFAIMASVKPGTTSKAGRQGMGLHYLKTHTLKHRGELRIRSGHACVDFSSTGAQPQDDMLLSPGSLIRIRTPIRG